MIRALIQVLANSVGLLLAAKLLPGFEWSGSGVLALLVAGAVIGLINLLVKPVVKILSCPLIILTLGLFYLVINGLMLLLADWLLDGLKIDGLGWAILGGIVMGLVNWLVRALGPGDER
jgi:putative membrane protein